MNVNTTRFGEVDVPDESILQFHYGLPGFPTEKEFAILPHEPDSPFAFLQSTHTPELTFLVVDPFSYFPDYEFEIDDATAADLGLAADDAPLIRNIVTVPEDVADMTANLLAPLIINRRTREAGQLVVENTAYTTKHRLFMPRAAAKEDK